ncbi:serine hydrolase [Xanthomonadaceae bacterium JHOS43]|nr:serine hydrolase [Xanthomonadaceae bacterium JHOS43]MCX7562322.1 serine hydrolase [Xanthomonadaceae bacterium XH05]
MSHSVFSPVATRLSWRPVVALCLGLITGVAAAQPTRFSDIETGWTWQYGASASTVNAQNGQGQRVVNLERVGTGSTYDMVTVTNSGSHAAPGTVVVHNQTFTQLNDYLTANNRRPLDLEVDESGGQERLTTVTVPNSGATGVSGWGWLVRTSQADITTWLNQNPGLRPIDLEVYTLGAQKHYAVVAVGNSGAEQRTWGTFWNATPTTIGNILAANSPSLLLDLELESAGTAATPPRFSGIWVNAPVGAGHWWYPALDAQGVSERVAQHGARLVTLKRYARWDGATRFAVSMIDNVNAETRRIRGILDSRPAGGITGFQIKRAGGDVLASLNHDYGFEPASTLKIAHSAATMLRASQGLEDLDALENYNDPVSPDACPNSNESTTGPQRTLGHIVRQTMRRSDNRATRHLRRLLDDGGTAFSGVNTFIAAQGLSGTEVLHDIGCFAPTDDVPFNRFTARDAVRLYERIGNGSIFNTTWRDRLFDEHMLNWPQDRNSSARPWPALRALMDAEFAATNLQTNERNDFRDSFRLALKPGGYSWDWPSEGYDNVAWRSMAGWARVPHRIVVAGNFGVVNRDYGLAMFRDWASEADDAAQVYNDFVELLRLPIREALQSWDAACTPPTVSATLASIQATTGSNTNLTLLLGGTNIERSFRWQRHNGSTWVDLSNTAGVYTGTTTATLTLLNVGPTSAGQYRARVGNYCGQTFGNAITVTVIPAGMSVFSDGFE